MLSKACEYGIKAITYIAMKSLEQKRVKVMDIAKSVDLPVAFTAKILGLLAKSNIIKSVKGPYGGFSIEVDTMKQVSVNDIIKAIDGESFYKGCVLGLSKCSDEKPCPMHHNYTKVKAAMIVATEQTSIYDLAIGHQLGKTVLIN